MARYARHYLDRGVDFDFALDDAAPYAAKAGVEQFAPPEPTQTDFVIAPGFQLASLVRGDNAEALVYVRNFAGTQLWETTKPQHWKQYLRSRRPAPLHVGVNLPGKWKIHAWDLDTGEPQQQSLAASGTLDFGATDHDFALYLHLETGSETAPK